MASAVAFRFAMMVEKAAVRSGRKSGKQQERTRRDQAEKGRGEKERERRSAVFILHRKRFPTLFKYLCPDPP
jgi:hypothetical protein